MPRIDGTLSSTASTPTRDAEPSAWLPRELWDRVTELADTTTVGTLFNVCRAFRAALLPPQLQQRVSGLYNAQTCPDLPHDVLVQRLASVSTGARRLAKLTASGPLTLDMAAGELSVAWLCPNGRFVISQFLYPQSVRIYDLAHPQRAPLHLPAFANGLNAVAISFDGGTALIADWGKHSELWNFRGDVAERIGDVEAETSLASGTFSPDSTALLVGHTNGAMLLDLRRRPIVAVPLPGPPSWTYSAVFSPDGKYAVTCGGDGISRADAAMRLWDIGEPSPRLVHEFVCATSMGSVWFSPDGDLLLARARRAEQLTLWDLRENPPMEIDIANHAAWVQHCIKGAETRPDLPCRSLDGGFYIGRDASKRATLYAAGPDSANS